MNYNYLKIMDELNQLINQIKNGTRDQRRNAAIRLGRIRSDRCVEPLIDALQDDYELTRVAAIQSLSWIGDDRMLEPLLGLLTNDESELVRKNAIEVLTSSMTQMPIIKTKFMELQKSDNLSTALKELIDNALSK
jgi:HEAT repeat protein